jgi:hypothetical protein
MLARCYVRTGAFVWSLHLDNVRRGLPNLACKLGFQPMKHLRTSRVARGRNRGKLLPRAPKPIESSGTHEMAAEINKRIGLVGSRRGTQEGIEGDRRPYIKLLRPSLLPDRRPLNPLNSCQKNLIPVTLSIANSRSYKRIDRRAVESDQSSHSVRLDGPSLLRF